MTLPADIAAAVVKAAARELADRAAAELDELQLVPAKKAAELLGVSEPKARQLIREWVDLGENSSRVRIAVIRELIASRTIYPNRTRTKP